MPGDLDAIVTGDLGNEGLPITVELLRREDIDVSSKALDCGLLIFDREDRDVRSGGSGCGCGATVLASHFLPMLESGELRDVLFVATGALMSPLTVQQGLTIPSVAHLVRIQRRDVIS